MSGQQRFYGASRWVDASSINGKNVMSQIILQVMYIVVSHYMRIEVKTVQSWHFSVCGLSSECRCSVACEHYRPQRCVLWMRDGYRERGIEKRDDVERNLDLPVPTGYRIMQSPVLVGHDDSESDSLRSGLQHASAVTL